jgi:hypothetical protein
MRDKTVDYTGGAAALRGLLVAVKILPESLAAWCAVAGRKL